MKVGDYSIGAEIIYLPSTIQTKFYDGELAPETYYNGSLKDWVGLGNKDSYRMHYNTTYEQFLEILKNG